MRLRVLVLLAFSFCLALAAGQLRADSVGVQNASFETVGVGGLPDGCGSGCAYNFGPIPGWTLTGAGGSFQPNSTYFSSVPNGSIIAFTNGSISQDLGVSLLPDTTYTLTVDVGNRLDLITSGSNYSIALEAGSTVLDAISGSNGAITPGTFQAETLTFTTGSTVASGDLTIDLSNLVGGQSDFDNVQLTAVAAPEPSSLLLLGSALGLLALFIGVSRRKADLHIA
jgi:hapalindole biogenesis HpiC1 cyclase-like protein